MKNKIFEKKTFYNHVGEWEYIMFFGRVIYIKLVKENPYGEK